MKITKSTWPIKVGAVAGLCLLFGIVYVLNPAFWGELWDVCRRQSSSTSKGSAHQVRQICMGTSLEVQRSRHLSLYQAA